MDNLLRFRDDAPSDQPVAAFADFAASNATAVRIEPGDDARALLPYLDRIALIEVTFPVFGDGRGYSAAQILRESGYAGELRACGDVLLDQMTSLTRAGFDSFAPDKPLDKAAVDAALTRFPYVYQKSSEGHAPIWALRHGS